MKPKTEVYHGVHGRVELHPKQRLTVFGWRTEWRWKAYSVNNQCIGFSEAYYNKADCIKNVNVLFDLFSDVRLTLPRHS